MENLLELIDMKTVGIALLTFAAVVGVGGAFVLAGAIRRGMMESRLKETTGPVRPSMKKNETAFLRMFDKLGRKMSSKEISEDLSKKMAQAGLHGSASTAIYMGAKMFLLVTCFIGFGLMATLIEAELAPKMFAVLGGASFGFFLPNLVVGLKASKRSTEIRRHLPDAVDLLEICVSGGMGLDAAWNAVTDEVRSVCPMLGDEMALTNLEKHLGADRGTAMRHMADRTGADELSSLVAVLVQSERFGTSVAEALRVFTENMREMRSQRAEEKAEEMAVKMLFPMVVLIFPVVLIVAVGPAGITLTDLLGGY